MFRSARLLFPWLLVLFVVAAARGQSFQGGIRGAVRDSTGVIPGVAVTLTNDKTNVSRTTVSNDAGEYVFTSVVPGSYSVTAVLEGFKTADRKGITVATQQFITLDLLLEVGSIQETVTVTGQAPLIDTSNASTGQVMDKATLEALPLGGRIAYFLAETVPSVIPTGNPTMNRFQDQGTQSSVSLGGGPKSANNYLLDGISITDLTNRPVAAPSMETLDEVKVQVHTYDAEMGRTGGGVYNSTARAGGNKFVGSLFYQARPRWGASNDYYNAKAGIPIPPVSYFSAGGSFGGPIIKNRTFFFLTTEHNRLDAQRSGVLTMPLPAMRTGDFSGLRDSQGRPVTIFDPLTTRPNPNGSGFIRDPFPGNVIPANRINPVSQALLQYLPNPDAGLGSVGNFTRTAILGNKADQFTTKIDHSMNQKWSMSGMYLWQTTTEPAGKYYGGLVSEPAGGFLVRPVKVFVFNNMFIPSPTSVLAVRFGHTIFGDMQHSPSTDAFDPATLGFASAFVNDMPIKKFPQFILSGYGEQVAQDQTGGALLGDTSPSVRTYYTDVVSASYSKLMGSHSLKAGGDYRKLSANLLAYGQGAGSFSFNKNFTQGPNPNVGSSTAGDAFASFLLGYPASGNASIASPYNIYTSYYGFYAQDDVRFGSNLTLNFGLRYEYEAGLQETSNRMTVGFDRNIQSPLNALVAGGALNLKGGLEYAGVDGYPTHQGNPSTKKFAPRVGFAWSPTKGSVVRGGYGRYFIPGPYMTNGSIGALGYNQVTQYFASADGLTPTNNLTNPFPTGLLEPFGNSQGLVTGAGGSIAFVDQNQESGYVHQYSADFERELPGSMTVTLGYVGARSNNVAQTLNLNQLDTQYLSLGSALQQRVPNPFYGIAQAGSFGTVATIARGQLLRPYPQFGDISMMFNSSGIIRYNALTAQVERRATGGIGFRVGWTYSKRKDNLYGDDNYYARQAGGTLQIQNNYDVMNEYATSLLDTPSRLNVTLLYQLPIGKGRKFLSSASRAVDAIIGGWQLTAIGMHQIGFPMPIVQFNNNSGLLGSGQRPNIVPGVPMATTGSTIDRLGGWFNPAAFSEAAPFTFGDAPRTLDNARSPNLKNVDFALEKTVPILGSAKGVFRLEAFDVFNFKNFRAPDTRFGLSTFGVISQQTGTNRQVQLTVRVAF